MKRFLSTALVTFLGIAIASTASLAADTKSAPKDQKFLPALIFDIAGKHDKSFGQSAFEGAEKFKKETGINYLDFEITTDAQREQAIRKMAQRGATIVTVVGFNFGTPLAKVADEFPNTKFVIIDTVIDKPNVKSITFKEEEGSFLVGMMAGLASKNKKVGFIGGMDIPLIKKFALGYKEGAEYVSPGIGYFENMIGNTPAAWSDPTKGGELARSQIDRGADVIFAAAGESALGVLQAAADTKTLAIGVDSNQNHLQPGFVLTSMVKHIDQAIYKAWKDAYAGEFKAGATSMGLAEDGVAYAIDDNNKNLVTKDMIDKVEKAKAAIIKGDLKVTDFTKTKK